MTIKKDIVYKLAQTNRLTAFLYCVQDNQFVDSRPILRELATLHNLDPTKIVVT